MKRFVPLFLALTAFALRAFAIAEPASPAALPEKLLHGDSDPSYPAEGARRLEAGKALLEQGDLAGAQEEFNKAEVADSYEAMVYFYQAVAFYRQGNYERALRCAETGEGVVRDDLNYGSPPRADSPERLQRFKELQDLIKQKAAAVAKGDPDTFIREGDEAYGKGLQAKAAAAYAKAFRADPTRGETGLKAASLYADRLKNLLEAAILWQEVIAAGEPHATAGRVEVQSHRDALDALFREGFNQRDQWRQNQEPSAALRLAQAFPESTELQIELAVLSARRGKVADMINHLQAASRLGMSADDFLAQVDFIDYLAKNGGVDAAVSQPLVTFVRDAYGEQPITAIRTELKRRTDETARLAREKAEKERQARLAAERKELTTWRNVQWLQAVQEVNSLISAHNNLEIEMALVTPGKKKQRTRSAITRFNSFAAEGGSYRFKLWYRNTVVWLANGVASPTAHEELISLPSFAPLREITVSPSPWLPLSTSVQPADPGTRALAREVSLVFNSPARIHRNQTMTYEYETEDGTTGYTNEYNTDTSVVIHALLQDGEVARLRALFQQLAQLDAAGSDLEKLRQLRK